MKKLSALFLAIVGASCITNAQEPGDVLFGSLIHTINIQFSQPGWKDSLAYYENVNDTAQNQVYLKGNIIIDGTLLSNVGIKYKGNSSYNINSDKKSFKIDFNEFVSGQKYDGLKTINLNNAFKDPTFLREKIMLDFMRDHNIHAPRCVYANVSINGLSYGLYTLVEEVDDSPFLKTHFGNKNGNLFKGDPSGNLKWLGNQQSFYYPHYELKTNESVNDWSDLVMLIDVINNSSSTIFYNNLEAKMKTNSYLKLRAANLIFVNLDSYDGSGHNYYIYDDNGMFKWIAWDVNEAFGNFNMGMTISQLECLSLFYIPNPPGSRPLPERMFSVYPAYKTQYTDYVYQWLDNYTPSRMNSIIDSLADLIRPYVYADPIKLYTNQMFEDNLSQNVTIPAGGMGSFTVPGLKSFYANRYNCIKNELLSLGYWPLGEGYAYSITSPQIYPNPASDYFVVEWPQVMGKVQLYDITGKQVEEYSFYQRGICSLQHLPGGLYLVKVSADGIQNEYYYKLVRD